MCGIAYIYHLKGSLNKNLAIKCAEEFIENRGPDFNSKFISKNEFIYQSVLAIQSDPANLNYRLNKNDSCFLYNGEIYSFDYGINQKYDNNLDNIQNWFKYPNFEEFLKKVDGMYAICKINRKNAKTISIEIFRDPAGEKHLFYYFDESKLVISSVPGFIREYCGLNKLNNSIIRDYISRRHFISPTLQAIKGINQLNPGTKLTFEVDRVIKTNEKKFKDIFDFFDSNLYKNLLSYSYSDFLALLEEVLNKSLEKMVLASKNNKSGMIISGGIDSSLSSYLLNRNFLNSENSFCLDFGGKEKPSEISVLIAKQCKIKNHYLIKPSVLDYKSSLQRCIRLISGPITTHSFASSMILASNAKKYSNRIIYGGEGADELFLGYKCYSQLLNLPQKKINLKSDYSRSYGNLFDNNIQSHLEINLERFYKGFLEYFDSRDAYIKASALVDYNFQLSSVGFFANDITFSDYGIEARSVFARSDILRLAISTPIKFLIKNNKKFNYEKKCLHDLFEKKIGLKPLSKSGFAGFPNETHEYLGNYNDWQIWDILNYKKNVSELARADAWKFINLEWFLRSL